MNAQPKASEPSMEEILASIRRIIADDQAKAPPPEAPKPALRVEPEPEPEPEPMPALQQEPVMVQAEPEPDDILDLDEPLAKSAETEAKNQDDIDLLFAEAPDEQEVAPAEPVQPETMQAVPQPVQPEPIMPQPVAVQTASTGYGGMDALLSGQVENHVQQAFASLAGTVLSNNARTLEDLVRDMLKPMLKTWLDDNLPALVERLVRAEIERVARGGRG